MEQEFKKQTGGDIPQAKNNEITKQAEGRSDYKFGVISGFISALLTIPIIINLGVFQEYLAYLIPAMVVLMPIGWVVVLLIARKIASKFALIYQIVKFGIVGFLNTVIDFGILNLLSWMTGIYSGKQIIILNSVAFAFAVTNSYFWNKYWTFNSGDNAKKGEFAEFLAVSVVGLIINTGIVYTVTTYAPLFVENPALLENIAKLFATAFALIWNFIGYKFIVFKK